MRKILIGIVKGYQLLISPLLGPRCRFTPTCSQFAIESIQRFGVIRGSIKAARRLSKCHPFHPGGADPVGEY